MFFVPRPRAEALAAFALGIAGFFIGRSRGEIVLILAAFMLAVPLIWSFAAVAVLAFLHRRATAAGRVVPEAVAAPSKAALVLEAGGIQRRQRRSPLELPAVLVRYRLNLATRDGKRIRRVFGTALWRQGYAEFEVPLRGAYRGEHDELVIRDVFGFFEVCARIPCGSGIRLSAAPSLGERQPLSTARTGGSRRRSDMRIIKTDDLVEQRPYVPGDDPRRINWKLYGHAGNLFVREEEREPPPHNRLVLLICAEADAALYKSREAAPGAAETDLLCDAALDLAVRCAEDGVTVMIGGCGVELAECSAKSAAALLARPWAVPAGATPLALPPPRETMVTILALPRAYSELASKKSALDAFITQRPPELGVTLLFLYAEERLTGAAEASALYYNRRGGVHAHAISV